ncbi:MAG: ribonuclease E/G [Acetobacteraceae bacterium]
MTSSPGEVRAAAIDGAGRLCDFALARPGAPDGLGDLHHGRVSRRVPSMAGSFVTIGGEQDGFLPDTAGAAGLAEGASLVVRIARSAQAGKGPRLARAESDATGPVGLIRRGPDAVLRLAARWPEAPILADDAFSEARLAAALPGRVGAGPGFGAALEAEIALLGEPTLALPGGAVGRIHPTPALVAIDIDAASAVTAPHSGLNRAVIPELARQLRLRNLSGAILIDLAGLSARRRKAFAPDFAASLRLDPLKPRFLGFTALGLAEIVRPRVAPPLHELLSGPHAAGLAALRLAVKESLAAPARRFTLRAAPQVAEALVRDPIALTEFRRLTGRTLGLSGDPALTPDGWALEEVQ